MSTFSDDIVARAETVLQKCRAAGMTVVTAESCTGGLIAACLTEVPGSSDVVDAGFITYSNAAKETMLDVAPSLIRTYGAVSEQVALAMAQGALAESAADIAVACTGIAGPGGATPGKPVGLVHLAVATSRRDKRHRRREFGGDRAAVRAQAVAEALDMILEVLEAS